MTAEFEAARRFDALDGLRGFAIAFLVAYHARVSWVGGGSTTLDMFFVLSGFLITRNLLREHAGTGRIAFGRFWWRRARRLAPASSLAVLFSVVVAIHRNVAPVPRQVVSALLGFKNWQIVWGGPYLDVLVTWWSLAVEEQYYLVYPLIVAALLAAGGEQRLTRVLWGLTAASLAAMILHFRAGHHTLAYYGTHSRLWELLLGCLLAAHGPLPRWLRWPGWLTGSIVLACQSSLLIESTRWWVEPARIIVVVAATALLIGAITSGQPGLAGRLLSSWPLRRLGAVSYEMYLVHTAVILLAVHYLRGRLAELTGVVAGTVALATLLHLVVTPLRARS